VVDRTGIAKLVRIPLNHAETDPLRRSPEGQKRTTATLKLAALASRWAGQYLLYFPRV